MQKVVFKSKEKEKQKPVQSMKVNCEGCNKSFKLKSIKLKYKTVKDDIQRLYYKCPHCKSKYTVGFKNDEINSNLERMKEISKEIKENPRSSEELMLKWNNLKARNLEIMNYLTELYGEEV